MTIPQHILDQLHGISQPLMAKRGADIFAGTDYPQDWAGFIGQTQAKEQLMVALASAACRSSRIDHTLIASGVAGVGKTTLATILAFQAGVGFMQTSGPLTLEAFRQMVKSMQDHDILFIDEIHRLTEGNRNRADWVLPFMTEGVLYTDRGAEKVPNIAIVGATTDPGKLPETLVSRFMVHPQIVAYTDGEGTAIAANLAERMHVDISEERCSDVAIASAHNPRVMRRILTTYRDMTLALGVPDMGKVFAWSGVTHDGLSSLACDILMLLLAAPKNTASIDSIKAHLGEPGPLKYHEQMLLQRGLIEVTGQGRKLTDRGRLRALARVREAA